MNLLETTEENNTALFVNFNQDCTSLAVGSVKGYKLYSFNSVDKLEVIHESKDSVEDIRVMERLFSSSLIAIVTNSFPRKLRVCHFKKSSEICNYSYSNTILSVRLNRQRLVVCLEESLYIHNIRDMKILHTIRDTPPNPNGICVLSICNENNFLAYPGSSSVGEVQIFDAYNLQAKSIIPAHDNPLAAMAFDPTGTKIATASEKGTVIRVFSVLEGTKLYEFRRGMKRCVTIYSLSFSEDSKFLSASSNTETVHVFRLDEVKDVKPSEESQGWLNYFGQAIINSASYLPTQVADMFYQGRSFATVHLPFSGLRNICVLAMIEKVMRVLVVAANGLMYIYDMEPNEGGICNLVASHSFIEDIENLKSNSENIPPTPQPDSPNVRRPFQPETEQENEKEPLPNAHHSTYENEFPPMVHKND